MARGFGASFGNGAGDIMASQYNVLPSGPRTYGIWVFANGLGGGNLGRVFDASTTTAGIDTLFISAQWNYQRAFSGSTITFQWPTTNTGEWHHYLIVYNCADPANVPIVYQDGFSQVITIAGSASGTPVTTTNNYYLGNRQSGVNRNFDGMLAHFCMWDGVLLNAADARALANGANPMSVRPDSIVSYMPLDGVNNPEFDFRNAPAFTQIGTARGRSEPPVEQFFLQDDLDNMYAYFQQDALWFGMTF